MTERRDSKQAEKTYLSRTGGSAWEREKPFSPPGDETLDDSLELLHDFAVAAKLLQPSPNDRIIDLGAGARLVLRPAAAAEPHVGRRGHLARDAAGRRERNTRVPIAAVAGDFERLPFVDGVVRQGDLPERAASRARHGRGGVARSRES